MIIHKININKRNLIIETVKLDLLNSFFQFITDKTQGLSHKAILIISVIILIFLIDNTLSITYYSNNTKKIDQIAKLNEVIKDTSLTNRQRTILFQLREDIINRKTWKDKLWDFVSSIDFKDKGNSSEISNSTNDRSNFWHFISSAWIFIFLMIIFPFVGLLDKKTTLGTTLSILLIIEPLFYGMGWLFAKLFSYIPIISNNPVYNYLLNSILSFILIFIIGFAINSKKKK